MSETRRAKLETRDEAHGPGFARLDAWRLSDELAVQMFHISKRLPANVSWLRTQAMRAAVSVPANIAEGYSRASNKELLQFLSVARGSLAELEYYLHFFIRTNLISETEHEQLRDLLRRAGQTLFGLMRSVRADVPDVRSASRYLRESSGGYADEQ